MNRFEGLISRSCLNGNLLQERDSSIEEIITFQAKTKKNPTKSQLGDLFFSYIKRKSRIKDTGNILPGHGGILDRIDGILVGLPVGFITLILLKL